LDYFITGQGCRSHAMRLQKESGQADACPLVLCSFIGALPRAL
jgi:hypothetical protein